MADAPAKADPRRLAGTPPSLVFALANRVASPKNPESIAMADAANPA
jgi:hypothetical protein